jgi:hypothetical protein
VQIGGDPADVVLVRHRVPAKDIHQDAGMVERFPAVVALEKANHLG